MSVCLDCGGAECVCRTNDELKKLRKAVEVYEAFFEHVESASLTDDAADLEVEGIYVDGSEPVRLTPRAKAAWEKVCRMIDCRRGLLMLEEV